MMDWKSLVLRWTALNGIWLVAHTGEVKRGEELFRGATRYLEGRGLTPQESATLARSLVLDEWWLGEFASLTARYTPAFAPGIRLYVWLLRRAMRRLVKEHPQLQNSERESQKLLKKQGGL